MIKCDNKSSLVELLLSNLVVLELFDNVNSLFVYEFVSSFL